MRFPKVRFFPLVTLSREEFIQYIIKICSILGMVNEDKKKEWINHVRNGIHVAHYFEGTIFIKYMSPYLLIHELIHHIARLLRYGTQHKIWYEIDWLIDDFDAWLFGKEAF